MRDWLTKDIGWKIFSVILALVIWLTIHQIREEPETRAAAGVENTYGNLPVLVVSASANVHDFRVEPDTVSITVGGPPDAMAVLQANQIRAVVDITDIKPSKNPRRHVDISTPPGVTLVNVEPPEVNVVAPSQKQ
jgi:YbbR domain-containing protein